MILVDDLIFYLFCFVLGFLVHFIVLDILGY